MSEEKKLQWKDTLDLPKTDFPMKAQLNKREPEILAEWDKKNLYETILNKRKDEKKYILHDGPPYANGNIHLGHALNKILKDFIVKSKSMEGYLAPFVPGWDCHGLPIEHRVDKKLGKKKREMDIIEVREQCRTYAEDFLQIQKDEFKRLGILGDWKNPYTTIDPVYEAGIIKAFNSFVKKGNVIRKKRPVYWCNSCRTALAEAEVEYAMHKSPSIYVKFLLKDKHELLNEYKDKDILVLIWTTTPWTIPANLAIAVHQDFDYSLFEVKGELFIAANKLIPILAEIMKGEYKIIKEFKGVELKGLNTEHPLYDRNSVIINTDYVTLDAGTGCVHTAPGHGEDDYRAGLEYGLEIYSPVGPGGKFDETTGKYEGKKIFAANQEIIEDLKANERLIYTEEIEHSYPHCWRCKKPVIYRATEQWFIAIDTASLRVKALDEIKKTNWLPTWGEDRISNMVANRPDWCISRQRDWGVPIPVFFCKDCGEYRLDEEAIEKVEKIFLAYGSNSWYEKDISEFLEKGTKCSKCGSENFDKGKDILDVWFESGASHNILENYPRHQFPADLYLEGGDQYRGWFHSSLLVSVSDRGTAPYKTVITHGWALDSKGKAMSKSMGNVISPQSIIDKKGAEILRLWVAMVNYREDVKLGNEVISRVTESYRKIRNTWKFMLGVVSKFNPDRDIVSDNEMREVDLYTLGRLQDIKEKILTSYNNYEYHTIYHTISNFMTKDLSAFYLNFIKDILYCNPAESMEKKSALTVIYKILKESILLLAPILSFTSEEAWGYLPDFSGKEESVHLETFPKVEDEFLNKVDSEKWENILQIKDRILKEIEETRNEKIIGDSLEAIIDITAVAKDYELLSKNISLFKEILVIAKLNITKGDTESIKVTKSSGNKCPRCWNYFEDDTTTNKYPELCNRCNETVREVDIETLSK